MLWDWSYALDTIPALLDGLKVTLAASALASILSVALGLFWAVLRSSKAALVRIPVRFLVDFLRGTPLLVQLFFVFYVLPEYGVTLSAFLTGVLALAFAFSGSMSEAFRAGILGVGRGQWETCTMIGLSRWRAWQLVILPQAVKNVLPSIGSYILYLFKETALLSQITVVEVLLVANNYGAKNFRYIEPLVLAGVLYFVISYPAARGLRWFERRISHG